MGFVQKESSFILISVRQSGIYTEKGKGAAEIMDKHRIYHEKVDINKGNTRDFYNNRALKLLGGAERRR